MPGRKGQGKVYSRYHQMDEKGYFDSNPANAYAVDKDGNSIYRGPVEYPKMMYHPKGEQFVQTAGVAVSDRNGPVYDADGNIKRTGDVMATKYQIVQNAEDEAKLREAGWHVTEAEALRAAGPSLRGRKAPEKSRSELDAERIAGLEARIAEMQAAETARGKLAHRPELAKGA